MDLKVLKISLALVAAIISVDNGMFLKFNFSHNEWDKDSPNSQHF
jgi:hypothetical protein